MGTFHNAFMNELRSLPHLLLSELVSDKLKEAGIPDVPGLPQAIADHVLSGRTDEFTWSDEQTPNALDKVSLTFSDRDQEKLEQRISQFIDALPTVVTQTCQVGAKALLKILKTNWPGHDEGERVQRQAFQTRLHQRWGKAFRFLRLLFKISFELGEESQRRLQRSPARRRHVLPNLIVRLHARACQVADEIIILMENGHADGAMARWRTLHEIGVVAAVITDGGETVALRYMAHEAVEAKDALKKYDDCHALLGYKPIALRERRKTEKAYDAVVKKYGKPFATQYGWAADHLKMLRPTFSHLEAAAQRAALRSHYKMACQSVHAGPQGLLFPMGLLAQDRSRLLAGPSNAGFVDPGQLTAITLTQITALLYHDRMSNLDAALQIQVLSLLTDDIVRALVAADRKLVRDHAAILGAQARR